MRFTGLDYEEVPFGAGFAEGNRTSAFMRNKNAIVLGLAILCVIVVTVFLLSMVPSLVGTFEVVPTVAAAAESSTVDSADMSGVVSTDGADTQVNRSDSESKTLVCVHVVGQVEHPGVYELLEGCRVEAAIEAAGGFTKKAESSALNLAALVVDGEQIVVPKKGSAQATGTQQSGAVGSSGSHTASSVSAKTQSLIDINHATASELTALPGIGDATAAKIVADREQNGPFGNPSDIQRVSGIGEKKYESIASMICAK